MTDRKPTQFEFTDCTGCGKRVATTARVCHHCNTRRILAVSPVHSASIRDLKSRSEDQDFDIDESESHAAQSYGGYDDHDLQGDLDSPKSTKKMWSYVAWILIIVLVLTTFLPWWF